MIEKLVLGTANFGMVYGVANQRKLTKEEVFELLDFAYQEGIKILDTAQAYGDAEEIIGQYISRRGYTFRVITKLPHKDYIDYQDIKETLLKSLRNLKLESIDYLLLHSYKTFEKQKELISKSLKQLKEEGLIKTYGISVYHPYEVINFMKVFKKDFAVEFPLNVFDQRFVPYLKDWKDKGINLFVRSVFLQGLFFLQDAKLTGAFEKVKDKIIKLKELAFDSSLGVACLCLSFVMEQAAHYTVVGVDNTLQLRELLACIKKHRSITINWQDFKVEHEDIILPYRWAKL